MMTDAAACITTSLSLVSRNGGNYSKSRAQACDASCAQSMLQLKDDAVEPVSVLYRECEFPIRKCSPRTSNDILDQFDWPLTTATEAA